MNKTTDIRGKIYVRIDETWFDLTNYRNHPGGSSILRKYHMKDATKAFNEIKGHSDSFVDQTLDDYRISDRKLISYLQSITSV